MVVSNLTLSFKHNLLQEQGEKSRAWPKADNKLAKEILEMMGQAATLKQVR